MTAKDAVGSLLTGADNAKSEALARITQKMRELGERQREHRPKQFMKNERARAEHLHRERELPGYLQRGGYLGYKDE